MCTGGLTGEMKLRFQIPPPNCERALDFLLLGVILVALFWLIVFVLFFSCKSGKIKWLIVVIDAAQESDLQFFIHARC